mmetsp:Transcript_59436/g.128532  ORF Transcript_59436/g.128532 Transcript_59436/m.128532 type:complete len:158 (-) Transcript_59436:356-829(-)
MKVVLRCFLCASLLGCCTSIVAPPRSGNFLAVALNSQLRLRNGTNGTSEAKGNSSSTASNSSTTVSATTKAASTNTTMDVLEPIGEGAYQSAHAVEQRTTDKRQDCEDGKWDDCFKPKGDYADAPGHGIALHAGAQSLSMWTTHSLCLTMAVAAFAL